MLVQVGYWPAHIEFDSRDLATVAYIMNKQRR